jgi:hypothetical protein
MNKTAMKRFLRLYGCWGLLAFSMATAAAANMQDGDKLYVNLTSNTADSYALEAVRKLTFTGNQFVVHLTDETQNATGFAGLRHLTFAPFFKAESIETVTGNRQMIDIYPNPVNDELKIDGYTLPNDETIDIFDVSGRLALSANTIVINVSALAKGVYFVQVGTAKIIKIIKK